MGNATDVCPGPLGANLGALEVEPRGSAEPQAHPDADRMDEGRRSRYVRRWHLRRFTQLKRIRGCGRWLNGSAEGTVAVRLAESGRAHFSGLRTCGSVWSCPSCSAKIRQARADELEEGLARWLDNGHGVEFLTATVPHSLDDDLGPVFDRVAEGWRSGFTAGGWLGGVRRLFGIEGYVRTVEVTYGRHGWHPHVHALLFTRRPLSGRRRAALSALMFSRWARWVSRAGGGECSRAAFRIVGGARGAGQYLTKLQDGGSATHRLGMEFTRGDLKTGRAKSCTPFELIEPAQRGEAWALYRWWEWEQATKGRRCVTWSRGGRTLLGLSAEQTTDDEEAAREVGGEIVCELGPDAWAKVVRVPGADAGLLRAVERRGLYGAGVFLFDLRAGP